MSHRILAIDGGGVRGALPAAILARLVEARPLLLKAVDLYAGTSTGGILALALADGALPSNLLQLYTQGSAGVFKRSWWRSVTTVGGLFGTSYKPEALLEQARGLFGERKLGNLGKRVLISAFDLDAGDRWRPKFFHNAPDDPDRSWPLVDVAMATSAAPTYLPSYRGYIDGGVIANNPTMAGIAHALDHRHEPQVAAHEVSVLSLGTGYTPHKLPGHEHRWGLLRWAGKLLGIMMGGSQLLVSYQAEQLLGKRHHRIAPRLPGSDEFDMDDAARVPELVDLAESYDIKPTLAWLDKHWLSEDKKQLRFRVRLDDEGEPLLRAYGDTPVAALHEALEIAMPPGA